VLHGHRDQGPLRERPGEHPRGLALASAGVDVNYSAADRCDSYTHTFG